MSKRNKKKNNKRTSRIISFILLIITLLLLTFIFYLNIIPMLYMIIGLILAFIFFSFIFFLNFSKKKGVRYIGNIFSILLIFLELFGMYYLFITMGFISNITNGNYSLYNYNVVVLKDSKLDSIKDIDNKTIGISETIDDATLIKLKNKIKKKINVKYKNYEDSHSLIEELISSNLKVIILENSEIDLLREEDITSFNELKIIYKIEIKNSVKDLKESVNINKEPFNIYISGIDTFGNINSSSRSDVNILVSVNPKTEKILITWIPRDYYLKINNSNYKDKLTHAGIYGIDTSIYAIENLLDVDINYYVKVNFTSVINIVDSLGGITIDNDESFNGYDVDNNYKKYTFKKGMITLDGTETLVYVRERHNVSGGDLGRGRHQVIVLEALINKIKNPDIIKNYNNLIKSLDKSFVTNMSKNTILSFVKKELISSRNWQIASETLTGTNGYEYTYSYKKNKLYVMLPLEESIHDAKEKLKEINNK